MKNLAPFRFLAALVGVALLASSIHVQAQTPPSKGRSSATLVDAGEPIVVTHHYLWMHHPVALAQLAKQVKGGAADRGQLERLVGPSFAEILLNANLSTVPEAERHGKTGRVAINDLGFLRGLQWPTALSSKDYAPKKLNLDKMVPDVVQAANEYVTSPIDGTVTASIVPSAASQGKATFWIAQLQSYTGIIKGDSEVPDQTSTGNTLPIKAGQNFIVSMQFAAYAGTYSGDLHLDCAGPNGSWSVVIPITMNVSSSNDYGVQLVGYNPQVTAFPGRPFNVTFTVKPINFRKPFFCFVKGPTTQGLAESTDPTLTQFYVKSSAPMKVTIACTCAPNAPIQDYVDFTQMITADNNRSSVVYTNVSVVPYQITWHCHDLQSSYTAPLFNSFGAPGSFSETWLSPELVVDGLGNFTFLGKETDGSGSSWNFNPKWSTQDMGAWFSYNDQTQGPTNYGSYNQISGVSQWLKKNWEMIFTGKAKLHFWYAPGPEAQYFDGNMPPLDKHGVFVMPLNGNNITIHKW